MPAIFTRWLPITLLALLTAATAGWWVRSYFVIDAAYWELWDHAHLAIISRNGTAAVFLRSGDRPGEMLSLHGNIAINEGDYSDEIRIRYWGNPTRLWWHPILHGHGGWFSFQINPELEVHDVDWPRAAGRTRADRVTWNYNGLFLKAPHAAWLVFWAALLFLWVGGFHMIRRARRRRRGLCADCAYDLRGSDGETCPECGAPVHQRNRAAPEKTASGAEA